MMVCRHCLPNKSPVQQLCAFQEGVKLGNFMISFCPDVEIIIWEKFKKEIV